MLLQLILDVCPWHAQLSNQLGSYSSCQACTQGACITVSRVAQVLVHGEEGAPHTAGIVVGTAEVELSLLHVMGQVSGWYNILDTRYSTASCNA